jgi:hypothetical protein
LPAAAGLIALVIAMAHSNAATRDLASNTIVVGNNPGDARCLTLPSGASGFGSIDRSAWSSWVDGVRFVNGPEFLELPGEADGKRALRQRFVPASNGTARVITGADLPEARTYRLVQSVKFESGWDWGGKYEGGKIGFGLSGGSSPTGKIVDTAGFSARMMWRGNGDGTGRMVLYSYAADRPRASGEDFRLEPFEAPIGEWFDLVMEIQMNSSTDSADGRMRAWANGQLLLDEGGVAWQTSGGTPVIDNLYFSTFYGGGTSEWSPGGTTYAQFRDVCWAAVVDGYSGIDPDAGRTQAPDAATLDAGLFNDGSDLLAQFEGPKENIRSRLEAIKFQLASLQENELPVVGYALEEATNHVIAAHRASHCQSNAELDPQSPSLLHIDSAILALIDASDARASTGVGAHQELVWTGELRILMIEVLDRVIGQVETELALQSCMSVASPACAEATQLLQEATELRELMSGMDGDIRQQVDLAASIWSAATRALIAFW